jgi:DnaA family protein
MALTMSEQLLLPISFSDSASFDNYYPGASAEVVEGLKELASGKSAGPYFIYGAKGTGKSHLLYALLSHLVEKDENAALLSLSDRSIQASDLDLVVTSGWVCIDDIDAWSGDTEKEQKLFSLFERVRDDSGTWVATGRHRPSKLGLGLSDLVSRISSSVVYRLIELNDHERQEALYLRAESRGLRLDDEAHRFFLTRTSRSTSDLFKLLDRIDKASLVEGRRVTVPFLRTLL